MLSRLSAHIERWPLAAPFRISRGVKTEAVVVVAQAHGLCPSGKECVGRGESVPYARYGETPDSVVAQIAGLNAQLAGELTRAQLLSLLPPGAARNAVDCALWDLEARRTGRSVAEILGQPEPGVLTTAVTVSLDRPHVMAEATRRIADAPVIKVKVDGNEPRAAIEAVARAAPGARLIVDPNESWTLELLQGLQSFLSDARVALVEQPLPASADQGLEGFVPRVPVCADESVHTSGSLERIGSRYQVVNIKLDKAGGLTEALHLRSAARERGLGVMIGCMVCTSLGIAPALQIAAGADFVDLDGPWWLTRDREGGARIAAGALTPPVSHLWGGPVR
jgi:L-Ala-D/L-Glu epimerase